ncbi:hypothetical protein F443_02771 [Phytophthora nicotianae P1569]|uniref:Uncharacterized protein n=1 Tax=Phytophthora nicotianae P1569 TaxID=1317065 RepID=V9FSH8_PHYNI|nr:hypothetical protein F443_02771 [Phytophthora nicotianae P1569]
MRTCLIPVVFVFKRRRYPSLAGPLLQGVPKYCRCPKYSPITSQADMAPLVTTSRMPVRTFRQISRTELSRRELPHSPMKGQLPALQKRLDSALRQVSARQRSSRPQPSPPLMPRLTAGNLKSWGIVLRSEKITSSGHFSGCHLSRAE